MMPALTASLMSRDAIERCQLAILHRPGQRTIGDAADRIGPRNGVVLQANRRGSGGYASSRGWEQFRADRQTTVKQSLAGNQVG